MTAEGLRQQHQVDSYEQVTRDGPDPLGPCPRGQDSSAGRYVHTGRGHTQEGPQP